MNFFDNIMKQNKKYIIVWIIICAIEMGVAIFQKYSTGYVSPIGFMMVGFSIAHLLDLCFEQERDECLKDCFEIKDVIINRQNELIQEFNGVFDEIEKMIEEKEKEENERPKEN